jgi:hypothetical protein
MATTITIDITKLGLNLTAGENYNFIVDEDFVSTPSSGPNIQTTILAVTTSAQGPTLIDTVPDLGDTNVSSYNIRFEFDRPVVVNSGNIYLYKDVPAGDELIATIPSSNSRIYSENTFLFVDVSGYLEGNTTYYLLSDANNIKDIYGISTGITTENVIKWTTANTLPVPILVSASLTFNTNFLSNFTNNRTYLANTSNNLFETSAPQITASGNFILKVNVVSGEFTDVNDENQTKTITLSGTNTQINGLISNYKYYPAKNFRDTDTLTISLYTADNKLLEKFKTSLLYSADGVNDEDIDITTSQSFTFNYIYKKYYSKFDLLLVGGGGSGNYRTIGSSGGFFTGAGSGGGGGGALQITNLNVNNYPSANSLTVGSGGICNKTLWPNDVAGVNGGNTIAFGYQAFGGLGAETVAAPALIKGGGSGYPSSAGTTTRNIGGDGGYNDASGFNRGGGGGGTGDPGEDAIGPSGSPSFGYNAKGGDAFVEGHFTSFAGRFGGGGGGGGVETNKGQGGDGGGGRGAGANIFTGAIEDAIDGTSGTGGGGGGGARRDFVGGSGKPGNGGLGIIKIKVKN